MPDDVITVRRVTLWLCDPCLDGAGGECHTPGCALWINRAPDLPLRDSPMVTVHDETGDSRFSTDPEALAWARGHVVKLRDKFRKFGSRCRDDGELSRAIQWRKFANLLDMELIGGKGCVIAPFDERRPEFAALIGEEKTDDHS